MTVPPKAEYELGFHHWFERLQGIARDTGLPLVIYANAESIQKLKLRNKNESIPLNKIFNEFAIWEEFLIFSREIKKNELFIIISSRKGYLSYHAQLEKLPYFLTSYFKDNSFIIVYPKQLDVDSNTDKNLEDIIIKPTHRKMDIFNATGNLLKKIFVGK